MVDYMNVNSIASPQQSSFYSKNISVKSEEKSVFPLSETVENMEQKDSSAIYKELSSRYDVRNATFEEITEMSKALYGVGKISFKEHAVLTFDFDKATNYLKRHAPGYIAADFDMYETFANSAGQRDWIAEFEARASKDFKYGNLIGYQSKMKVLNILERLSS